MSDRPIVLVLAGVNGAGKSSVLGAYLQSHYGIPWFNPDTFARELVKRSHCDQREANARAWQEGMDRLQAAIQRGTNFAFETTLGGNTVPQKIREATSTHEVFIWYCGLDSADRHIQRVRERVSRGGHDIPEDAIRERYQRSPENLALLMPDIAALQIFDNSVEPGPDGVIADPMLVLSCEDGQLLYPGADDAEALSATPKWARSLVELAIRLWGETGQ